MGNRTKSEAPHPLIISSVKGDLMDFSNVKISFRKHAEGGRVMVVSVLTPSGKVFLQSYSGVGMEDVETNVRHALEAAAEFSLADAQRAHNLAVTAANAQVGK
jgi:hypothetical protein